MTGFSGACDGFTRRPGWRRLLRLSLVCRSRGLCCAGAAGAQALLLTRLRRSRLRRTGLRGRSLRRICAGCVVGCCCRLLAGFRRLLRRGAVCLLCAKQRRGAQPGNQQGTQDSRDSVLHCHKNLGKLVCYCPNLFRLALFDGISGREYFRQKRPGCRSRRLPPATRPNQCLCPSYVGCGFSGSGLVSSGWFCTSSTFPSGERKRPPFWPF